MALVRLQVRLYTPLVRVAITHEPLNAALDALDSLGDPAAGGVRVSREMRLAIRAGLTRYDPMSATSDDGRHALRRLLLHLPRLASDRLADPHTLSDESRRIAAQVSSRRAELGADLRAPRGVRDVRELVLGAVARDVALEIHRTLHYLESPREGLHFGLYSRAGEHPANLHALFTLSPLDVPHLIQRLPDGIASSGALVLSRLFAFAGAPANTLSFGLSLLARTLSRTMPGIRLLLTYLNPNLGFTGGAYRAANWVGFGTESKQGYLYRNGLYVTEREALAHSSESQRAGYVMERSRLGLRPLELYALALASRSPRATTDAARPSFVTRR